MSHKSLSEQIGAVNLKPVTDSIGNGLIPPKLLKCEACNTLGNKLGLYLKQFVVFKCANDRCNNHEWLLCLLCVRQRKRMVSTKQATKHLSNFHQNMKGKHQDKSSRNSTPSPSGLDCLADVAGSFSPSAEEDWTQKDDTVTFDDGIDNEYPVEALIPTFGNKISSSEIEWIDVQDSHDLGFRDTASQRFFQQCFLSDSPAAGRDYLVKNSFAERRLHPNDVSKLQLPGSHAQTQMKIAKLAYRLTVKERDLLAEVLHGSYEVGCEDGYGCAKQLISKNFDSWARQQQPRNNKFSPHFIKTSIASEFSPDLIVKGAYVWSTRIPQDGNDIRRFHVEGKHSIIQNLPIPTIHTNVHGHSYVSIIDCIRELLSHEQGGRIALIPDELEKGVPENVLHCSESSRARTILEESKQSVEMSDDDSHYPQKVLVSYVIAWSDDVEPNQQKANRGSIWLLTATVATLMEEGHRLSNTYPIAIGKKGDDHGPVIAQLEKDLENLRNGTVEPFFVGAAKKRASIRFGLLATLQDQPERRDFNDLMSGNSTHLGRFGVSANHGALYGNNKLQACKKCLSLMQRRLSEGEFNLPIAACPDCLNWDVLADEHDLSLFDPPKDYPLPEGNADDNDFYKSSPGCRLLVRDDGEVDASKKQVIRPFQITYESLKIAVDLAHEGYCNYGWTPANCEKYLAVEGLNTAFATKFIAHAMRCLCLKVAKLNPHLDENRDIIVDAEANPEKYQRIPYPIAWTRKNIPLTTHPDVIMHLVFLGIVKALVKRNQKWLKTQKKNTSFIERTAPILNSIVPLQVEWCDILPYTGAEFGNYVSENYLAFSRVSPWFYQNIGQAASIDEVIPPEGLAPSKWTKAQNQYWLEVRGQDTEGTAEELKARVRDAKKQDNPPEPIAEPDRPASDVMEAVIALYDLLKCVMSKQVTAKLVNKTRYAVRIFLSKYDKLSLASKATTMKKKKKKKKKNLEDDTEGDNNNLPPVLSKFNFICLLNLPEMMERYGPLRDIWEGGPRGEGFLRFAKPFMTQGFRLANWHYHLLKMLHRAKSMESIVPPETKVMSPVSSPDALKHRKRMFHKYDSEFTVLSLVKEDSTTRKAPIVVLIVEDKNDLVNLFAVVAGDYTNVLQIDRDHLEEPIEKFGFFYYKFDLPQGKSVEWSSICGDVSNIGFGMLLPMLDAVATADNEANSWKRFALISSNWHTLNGSTPLAALLE